MPLGLKLGLRRTRIRCSWTETGVWAGAIVMFHPTLERLPNMCLADRNDEIQTLSAGCAPQKIDSDVLNV